MDTDEEAPSFPRDVEKLTVSKEDFPEGSRTDYVKYLESRIFDLMGNIRPWGINGITAKELLMDALAEEEIRKGFAAPSSQDVEAILNSCWKMSDVQKDQKSDEISSILIQDTEKKPTKVFSTAPNGIVNESRNAYDFGVDLEVLRELASRKNELSLPKNKLSDAFNEHINKKCPNLKRAFAEISVVDLIHERKLMAYRRYKEEETVGSDRWDWLKDKQESLRQNDAVNKLMRSLFSNENGEKQTETSSDSTVLFETSSNSTVFETSSNLRRTRNTSISSVSSSSSRQPSVQEAGGAGGAGGVEGVAEKGKKTAHSLKRPLATPSSRPTKMAVRKGKS